MPVKVFQDLLEEYLVKKVGIFIDHLDDAVFLRQWIHDVAGVYETRFREPKTVAHVDEAKHPGSIACTRAGVPTSIHECSLWLLESGFLPRTSVPLYEKLEKVLELVTKPNGTKLHIPVDKAATMMCIPDESGILEPNEVSIRFGNLFTEPDTGRPVPVITGDVLVARVVAIVEEVNH